MSSEQSKSLSWPQTVVLMPASHIRFSLLHVCPKVFNIALPNSVSTFVLEVLNKDRSPLLASNVIIYILDCASVVHLAKIKFGCHFNI